MGDTSYQVGILTEPSAYLKQPHSSRLAHVVKSCAARRDRNSRHVLHLLRKSIVHTKPRLPRRSKRGYCNILLQAAPRNDRSSDVHFRPARCSQEHTCACTHVCVSERVRTRTWHLSRNCDTPCFGADYAIATETLRTQCLSNSAPSWMRMCWKCWVCRLPESMVFDGSFVS